MPKIATESVLTASEDTVSYVNIIAQRLAKKLVGILNAEGVNILSNAGIIAGQSVFHYHVHIIPRYTSDELKFVTSSNPDGITETYEILKNNM